MRDLHDQIPAVHVAPRTLGEIAHALDAAGLLAAPVDSVPPDVVVLDVTDDSRQTTPGTLFGALSADTVGGRDGHDFVEAAVLGGATAALVSREWLASTSIPLGKGEGTGDGPGLPGAVLVPVTDTRAALAEASSLVFEHPGRQLELVGVTGTNGKTTTAFLIHHLLTALGQTAGLVGTVENRIGRARYATAFTTPEAPALHRFLRACVEGGCTHVAMETSSHGLALDRVRGLPFRVAVFTNLTHDHLDFHPTFEAYREAKQRLFTGLDASATVVVNADDPAHAVMTAATAARVVTYGTASGTDVHVEVLDNAVHGLRLRIDGHERRFQLAGRFNALNLAAAYAVGRALGFEAEPVLDALAEAPGVPGRFETVRSADGVLGVVDYAHTPDALDNVLATAREIVPKNRRLWVVFGCGGDRDTTKRPEMAAVAEARADRVVLTSDNPRTERPDAILDAIEAGLARPHDAERIVDRQPAIAYAAQGAAPGDVVVVAGKGHETYQIVGREKRPFDDRVALRDAFAARSTSPVA